MVRMRWLALALACTMATTVHAQSTQDTTKAKPTVMKPGVSKARTHTASTKGAAMAQKRTSTGTMASKSTHAGADSTKPTAKAGTKPATHRARKSTKPKAKPDTTTKKKG